MSAEDLRPFLIAYLLGEGRAEVTEYGPGCYGEALGAYRASGQTHRDDLGVEVVLLSADSRESLMATHGRFFAESGRHVDDYITERLDELPGERGALA